jgi:Ca2+-binding RTX toxin-like protein
VSDTAGTFGPLQVISPEDQVGGPGVALNEMELAAGGGEFTAIWVNDHNADGQTNEVYMSSSASSTFGAPDQISDPSSGFLTAYVARNGNGDSVGGFSDSDTGFMWATPVNLSAPAAVFGTNGADRLGGTAAADIARLGAGNDRFNGKGGNDQIFGEAGNDFLDGGSGRNVLNGGPGRDTCVKRSKRDRLKSCERVRRNH